MFAGLESGRISTKISVRFVQQKNSNEELTPIRSGPVLGRLYRVLHVYGLIPTDTDGLKGPKKPVTEIFLTESKRIRIERKKGPGKKVTDTRNLVLVRILRSRTRYSTEYTSKPIYYEFK